MKLHQRTVALAAALGFLLAPLAFAQTPAPAAPAAPAAPRKLISPYRGDATVEFIEYPPTRVKDEIQTKIKLRNTSKGSIALLSVEEFWYVKSEIGSNGIYRHRKLLNPGEIIEFVISAPSKPGLDGRNMLMFKHANGTVKPTKVKKLP